MESQQGQGTSTPAAKSGMWIALVIILVIVVSLVAYMITNRDGSSNTSRIANGTNTTDNDNSGVNVRTETTSTSEPFINAEYDYSLQLPGGLYVIDRSIGGDVVEFNESVNPKAGDYSNSFLIIRVTESPPAQVDGVNILLDTKPTATRVIDRYDADIYEFPNGYEGSPSFIVFKFSVGAVYYRLDFWNVSKESTEIAKVIDSFKITQ